MTITVSSSLPSPGLEADRKQNIEFDPGAEYYGVGRVPYLYPEHIHFRLDYARARNAHGYVARIERHAYPSAIPGITEDSGWNVLNLYAYKEVVGRLDKPDARTVGEVMRESATAVALAREVIAKLEVSKEAGLGDAHYQRYLHRLTTLLETAETWAEHRNTYIRNRSGGLEPTYDGPFPVGGPPRPHESE